MWWEYRFLWCYQRSQSGLCPGTEAATDGYFIVHAGFANSIVDEQKAQASLQVFQELSDFEDACGNPVADHPMM